MAVEEAIVAAEVEEGTKEAPYDKDKSSHRSIDGSSKDEGSDNVFCGSSDDVSNKIPAVVPTRFLRRLRRDDGSGGFSEAVGRWLENSSENKNLTLTLCSGYHIKAKERIG